MFRHAYAQQAESEASSEALLSGRRPGGQPAGSGVTRLPSYFESRGFRSRTVDSVDDAVAAVNASIANFFVALRFRSFDAGPYLDRYPAARVSPSANRRPPRDAPEYALHDARDVDEAAARGLMGEYYAWITAVDDQVGRLLDALEAQGLTDSTAVVLAGLHGRHLGDLGLWGAQTNFESATRTPLIVSYPDQRAVGRQTKALTELADLYPSICDIAGLEIPNGLEGSSFTPLFADPDRLWKRAVFSEVPRAIPGIGDGVGRSMRTSRFRYTEWRASESSYRAAELYDYRDDPVETRNLASSPKHQSLANGLAGILAEDWRGSLPPTDPRSGASS